jgi:hypothetical protein
VILQRLSLNRPVMPAIGTSRKAAREMHKDIEEQQQGRSRKRRRQTEDDGNVPPRRQKRRRHELGGSSGFLAAEAIDVDELSESEMEDEADDYIDLL